MIKIIPHRRPLAAIVGLGAASPAIPASAEASQRLVFSSRHRFAGDGAFSASSWAIHRPALSPSEPAPLTACPMPTGPDMPSTRLRDMGLRQWSDRPLVAGGRSTGKAAGRIGRGHTAVVFGRAPTHCPVGRPSTEADKHSSADQKAPAIRIRPALSRSCGGYCRISKLTLRLDVVAVFAGSRSAPRHPSAATRIAISAAHPSGGVRWRATVR